MRLIDADVLKQDINNVSTHWLNEWSTLGVLAMVDKQPTVDAVPVVRCKDCKHRIINEHYGERGYIKLKAYCELDTGDVFSLGRRAEDDNWFCADGERKVGADDV